MPSKTRPSSKTASPEFDTEAKRRAFVAQDDSDTIEVVSNEDGLGEFEPMSPSVGE